MGTQTAATPRSGTNSPANPIMSFIPMIAICFILYFLLIKPQQKQAKEHKQLIDSLKAGDRVLTQGGVYGTVVSIKDGIVQVKVAENVRMDFARTAITQVIKPSTEPAVAVIDA